MTDAPAVFAWSAMALVLAPLLAAALTYLVPWPRPRSALPLAAAVALPVPLIVLTATLGRDGAQHATLGGHRAPLGIAIAADGLTLGMLWLTALVMAAVLGYLHAWLAGERGLRRREIHTFVLLLWTSLNALYLSADLFNLYVALEIVTLTALPLVVATPGVAAVRAALRYLLFALAGSALYLLGVALVYTEAGVLTLALFAEAAATPATTTALAIMTAGLAIKGALFPVHAWLPQAHAVAPSPASALLSALVATAAVYALLRLWLGAFSAAASPAVLTGLGAIGCAGMVYASLQALRQPRLKLVIAYSTVAQLAYFLLALPLASLVAWQGVIYHGVAHGLAKASLFLAAGNLIRVSGHDRLTDLAGSHRALGGSVIAIGLAGVSLAGLPPSGGFVGKWWLIQAALASGQWWWALAVAAGGLLAAGYVFRILRHALADPGTGEQRPATAAAVAPAMVWAPVLLAGAAIALGFTGDLLAPWLAIGAP